MYCISLSIIKLAYRPYIRVILLTIKSATSVSINPSCFTNGLGMYLNKYCFAHRGYGRGYGRGIWQNLYIPRFYFEINNYKCETNTRERNATLCAP